MIKYYKDNMSFIWKNENKRWYLHIKEKGFVIWDLAINPVAYELIELNEIDKILYNIQE